MSGRAASGLWGGADVYDQYMGRWSRKIAPLFLEWLAAPRGCRWAEIGSGTGELSMQIASLGAPSQLVGVDSSATFLRRAADRVPTGDFREGDAACLDLPDGGFDVVVSGLVLNFISDKAQALREMVRVVRPGGTVALYVWDYAGHMQIMRHFFDAARQIDPASSAYDDGVNAPICRPKPLTGAFLTAGITQPEITALDAPAAFVDFKDYWQPFLGGTGSAPKYCASLDPDTRSAVRDAVRARLPIGPDGEILLAVRAWAIKGTTSC